MRQPFNLNSPIAHPEQNEAALAGLVLPDIPAIWFHEVKYDD